MKPVSGERKTRKRPLSGTGFTPFIIRRLLTSILLVFGVTFISFSITQLVPGDPVAANLGQSAYSDPEIVAAFEKEFGLDQPVPVQYYRYITNLLQGDLGVSLSSKRPVAEDLKEYFPATLEIALVAVFLALIVGLLLGIISAVTRDRWPDQIIRVFSLTGVSMPAFSAICLKVEFSAPGLKIILDGCKERRSGSKALLLPRRRFTAKP